MLPTNALLRLTVVALAVTQAFSSTAIADDDWPALRGRWRLTSYISEGESIFSDTEFIFEFDPPLLRITEYGIDRGQFKNSLDGDSTPKKFDASYTGDNAALKEHYAGGVEGIYEIKGDTLRRCFSRSGRGLPRPDKFDASAGSGNVLITLERIK